VGLKKRVLRRDDLADPRVERFYCGALKRDDELVDYLRRKAIEEVEDGKTLVWLYFDDDDQFVGYSSLSDTRWRTPPPKGDFVPLQIIPYLAVATEHQGNRYSRAILGDTIAEALERRLTSETLGLFVHVENAAAIHVYSTTGFEPFGEPIVFSGEPYQRMLVRLPEPAN
jgi:RimJ/RimL family protein N-acetyltransferase